jgi:hypothetical protein
MSNMMNMFNMPTHTRRKPENTVTITRRDLLRQASLVSIGFTSLHALVRRLESAPILRADVEYGLGPLHADPQGVFDVPAGFSYHVFSKTGERMDDGFYVPAQHDGMAAFPGPDGLTILVRNHEIGPAAARHGAFGWNNELLDRLDAAAAYDLGRGRTPSLGGTSTLVYDTSRRKLRQHFLSLAGTSLNCAGGPTPWGTWISCEETEGQVGETHEKDHGYPFEVPATIEQRVHDAVPIRAMGRFKREAVAVDPSTGIVYMTEDQHESLLYRYIPHTPGRLLDGGRVQALALVDQSSCDTRNWTDVTCHGAQCAVGSSHAVRWIDMENIDSPNNDLRFRGFDSGAARFARGEGIWFGDGCLFIACTNGGPAKRGQVYQYTPGSSEGTPDEDRTPGRLQLFLESGRDDLLRNADNITMAPWGDLVISEDSDGSDRIVGVTPGGHQYLIAANRMNNSELAGVTFSPDGSTLFVNMQEPGLTVAITGPWSRVLSDRQSFR